MKQSVVQRALVAAGFCGAVLALTSTLTACVPLVLGGAAAGTMMVATDRRTSGAQLEDEGIELRGLSRIRGDFGTRVRVNVVSYNRQVLLTGEVPNEKDKQAVEQLIAKVENVVSVVNSLAVRNTPSLADRSADLLITGRIKAALLDARDWLEWSELFSDDGVYWMPSTPDQTDWRREPSIFAEDQSLMEVRRGRLQHPNAWSQAAQWGTNHLVGNIVIEAASADALEVYSRFQMMELRRDTVRHFGGSYRHSLVKVQGQWKIRLQRVDMTNAQAAYDYVIQAWV